MKSRLAPSIVPLIVLIFLWLVSLPFSGAQAAAPGFGDVDAHVDACEPNGIISDAANDVSIAHIDAISVQNVLDGETLRTTFRLRDVPSQLTFNRPGVPVYTLEYQWEVAVDVDNNASTGSTDALLKGADFRLSAAYTNTFLGAGPIDRAIKDYVDTAVWRYSDGSWTYTGAQIAVDVAADTITLTGKIPGIGAQSQLFFSTFDYNPGGASQRDDNFAKCPPTVGGLPATSTATRTRTPTPSATATATPTATATRTRTLTPSASATATSTSTQTRTLTPSATATATPTSTRTRTPTSTIAPSLTPLTFSISGSVTDVLGHGINGVTITGAGSMTITDDSGSYTLAGVTQGTWIVTPAKFGFTFSPEYSYVQVASNVTGWDFVGYDKPPIVFVHGWNGLSKSCDWVVPEDYFEYTDNELHVRGYYVTYASLESSLCYTPSIEENVWRLDEAIQLAKENTNQEKVILIAHSMGGLVSRAYIEGGDYDNDVAQVFTFGSPHLGVPVDLLALLSPDGVAFYCLTQPAACDFSSLGMKLFDLRHPFRRNHVTYHVVSGDAPWSTRTVLGKAFDLLLLGADDGAVPMASGLGLTGHLDRWQTDETHGDIFGSKNYFARDGGTSKSYSQCLKPVLVDRIQDYCNPLGPSEPEAASDLALTANSTYKQRSPFVYGNLQSGQTNSHPMVLEGGATSFAAQWTTGSLLMTLMSPDGQVIDPAYAAAYPGVVTYQESAGYAIYEFPNAAAGTWQVRLQAVTAPTAGAAYTAFAAFESDLTLSGAADRHWYAPGSTASITATLAPTPQSASVAATILLADGSNITMPLASLGAGRYQGSYRVPASSGYAEVRLVAAGIKANGAAFERGVNLAFQISPNTVALNGIYGDAPDPDSAGVPHYKALTVTVGVDVNVAGAYGVSAEIVDAAGVLIAHASGVADLAIGKGSLILRFNGADIFASQRDGPYTLTNLLLTDHNGAALVAQEAQNVYTTAAYSYRDFGTNQVYLPLVLKHSGSPSVEPTPSATPTSTMTRTQTPTVTPTRTQTPSVTPTATTSPTPTRTPLPSTPLAYWQLDEGGGLSVFDATGHGSTGTLINGPTWSTGKIHGALSFDGSDDYVRINRSVVDTSKDYTVAAWVMLREVQSFRTAVSQEGAEISGFYLQTSWDGKFAFGAHIADSASTAAQSVIAPWIPQANQWYHLVGVHDSIHDQIKLYVNGALIGTEPYNAGWNATGNTLIGRAKHGGNPVDFWPGKIDEVYLFDHALNDAQIQLVYLGPAAYWQLDEGSGLTADDATGKGNTCTLVNGPTWSTGKVGGAISFDGSNDYVQTSHSVLDTSKDYTVAAWVMLREVQSFKTAVSQAGVSISAFYLQTSWDGKFTFGAHVADSPSADAWRVIAPWIPQANQWYHLVGVHDSVHDQIKLYVDGALIGTEPYSAAWNATGNTLIGRAKHGGNPVDFWPGKIDEVYLFDRVLSDADILTLYRQASGG